MSTEITWLATLARTLWEVLERHYGVDPAPLFEEAGIDPADINEPGRRITVRTDATLLGMAARLTGDPYIGLTVGQRIRVPNAGVLGFAWMASESLLDGLRRNARYVRLLSTAVRLDLDEGPKSTRASFTLVDQSLRPTVHTIAVSTLQFCRLASDRTFAPRAAHFMEPKPAAAHYGRFKSWFACPIAFGADIDALDFDTTRLCSPLPAHNPVMIAEGERILERQLRELSSGTIVDRVKQLIIRALPTGEANAATVAARLNRSVSSMQRDLREAGESFRSLLERTRHELACDYLRGQSHSLSEITFLLGYADQAGFTRAFRRWEGCSPGQYRDQASSTP